MMAILTNGLFILTAVSVLLWVIDQLFLEGFKKQNGKRHVIMSIVYVTMPYLLLLCFLRLIFMMRQGINFDFNYILVPATLFFLLIYVLDKTVYKDRKRLGKGSERALIASAYDFLPVLAVVVVVRTFMLEPFNIPSSSMVPTLYTGDYVAVNKSAYGLRLPITHQKIVETGQPKRGDVAVFRYPKDPSIYYIKRIIGLPGDTVAYKKGQLYLNGKPVPTQPVDFVANPDMTRQMYRAGRTSLGQVVTKEMASQQGQFEESQAHYYQETIGEHQFLRRHLSSDLQYDAMSHFLSRTVKSDSNWEVQVPAGNYFVMGDNTDRSGDSRFWGFVSEAHLSGKAFYIWMHKEPGFKLPTFSRNGAID